VKRWLLDNGLYVAWLIIGIYVVATFVEALSGALPFIACSFFLLYGTMAVILFEFHRNIRRLTIQIAVVAGAIVFEIIEAMSEYSVVLGSLSLAFFALVFVDSLSLHKLVRKN
jgi:hypothetical protein